MFPPPKDADKPVLVLGGAGIDFVGRLQASLQQQTSTPAKIRASFGGVARNVAENLARLGLPVELISAVGDDLFGSQLLKHTRASGVETEAVLQTPDHPTGSYLAVVGPEGQLQFALDDMRVIQALKPSYLRKQSARFRQAAACFFDANLPPNALRTTVNMAKKEGLLLCADPTSTSLADHLVPYLDQIDVITPNIQETARLLGHPIDPSDPDQGLDCARKLVSRGVKFVIVTMAEFGLCYATSDNSGHVTAPQIEILDPTGAGDALTAAVIFALLNDIPIDEAVRLGVTAASLTLRCKGTVVPDLSLEMLYDQLIY